jgi:hypothetical protein
MGHHVPGQPYRYKHGWIPVAPIHASDLSTPDARRSPEVSADEFQGFAQRGAAKYDRLKAGSSEPTALKGASWDKIKADAFASSREPWGGMTVDTHTGKHVPADADAYALTVREPGMKPVHVSPKASRAEFDQAMETAKARYADILARPNHHLGVFHDQDTNSIDIDPVLVTPSLEDVHEIGAYTRAVGGAYHFKSGDGFWPPHVKDAKTMNLTIQTPMLDGHSVIDLSDDGSLAYWKQILPKKTIRYTGKDGKRHSIDFNDEFLHDLANNKIVDEVGFLLADKDNAHTMDPERWRGKVDQFQVRDDGLYAKIVFPNREAAKAVLDNPNLGVSARIIDGGREGSDGTTVSRGIVHVLGTLDPQVSGMSGWQTADLSTEAGDLLDLTSETFEEKDMARDKNKSVTDYTAEDIEALDGEELDSFLAELADLLDGSLETDEAEDDLDNDEDLDEEREPAMSLSNEAQGQIDLANDRANTALRQLALSRWEKTRDDYLSAGVPPHLLDLAAPIFTVPDEFVVDLSNTEGQGAEVDVSRIVRGLLDAAKGTIDLSAEEGHGGTFKAGDGEDPDAEYLNLWNAQF